MKDFAIFVELWNMEQGYKTPFIHYKIANWLQTSWKNGDKRLLLMAFRASGKSTLVGLFCAWLLLQDPDLRILIIAAENTLAAKMVRNVRKVIEKHALTVHLLPKNKEQWASDRFTIKRHKELRDPSLLAAGITGNITGNRADIIIYDDVEVPNTCDTSVKRQNLRERLAESNFILAAGGTQLYVGTPHTYFSIYAEQPRKEVSEDNIFLLGYKRYLQPMLNNKKQSVWPEQFDQNDVELIKKQSGPNNFMSQMMLKPINIIEGRLDTDLLQYYNRDIVFHEAQQLTYLFLNGRKIMSCSAWWDPAFGSAKGDNSVLAVIFTDDEGLHYLHHLSYIEISKKINEDEANLQCKAVVKIIKKFLIPSVTIETNGIGKFLPAILRRELAKENLSCSVVEHANHRPKETRILESFDAVMAAKSLYVHNNIRQTPFLTEMMEWQPKKNNQNDDGLDAVAGALSLEPVRLKRLYSNTFKRWQGHGQTHQADTDFKV